MIGYLVQIVFVLALGSSTERNRNDFVFAKQELAVGPAGSEIFEEDVALIEHGDDVQVIVLVQTFSDLATTKTKRSSFTLHDHHTINRR